MRYSVRGEFFGGLAYDKLTDMNIMLDEEFFEALWSINEKGSSALDHESRHFLEEEGFLFSDGNVNYRIVRNQFKEETLSAPGRVHFYYTAKCNLNCSHCFTKELSPAGTELTISEKINLLDQMVELGVNEILIGGGEPFIRPDFPEFVEAALSRGIVTKVFTNGLLLNDEKLVKRMASWDLKYLSISVDGCNEFDYEYVRGVKGLETIKKVVKLIKKYCSFTLAASITVNSENHKTAPQLLDLISDMGFDRLKVRPVKPAGNVERNRAVFPTAKQYATFIREAQAYWLKKYRGRFSLDFSWGDTRLEYEPTSNVIRPIDLCFPYEGYGCFAGKVNIVFDACGNAITCGFLPEELKKSTGDNLRNKRLKDIWDAGMAFSSLRDLPGNDTCIKCHFYPVCRGGCFARNIFLGIDINEVDPWCLRPYFPMKIEEECE